LLFHILIILVLGSCGSPKSSQLAPKKVDTEVSEKSIHTLMEAWHHAAATADEETFFRLMSDDAIYLGTDKTERWEKAVFEKWAMPHFQKDSAWVFHAHDRVVYFSEDGQTAWFEELLDTWMGPCRGSGVLRHETNRDWKIAHYNLAMLIDNDDVREVIDLITKPTEPIPLLPNSQ